MRDLHHKKFIDWVTVDERTTDAATFLNIKCKEKVQRLHHRTSYKNKNMWKNIKYPKYLSETYEANKSGKIRHILTHDPAHIGKNSEGYEILNVSPKTCGFPNDKIKVHRIIAATFIGDISGKEVHHIDGNRSNNHYKNLEILSRSEHRHRYRTIKGLSINYNSHVNGKTILTEKDVRNICELLVEGYSYPRIREKLKLFDITDDCIGKIAKKKIWKDISSEYNIKTNKRRCMDLYSSDVITIAMMVYLGYNTREIGEKLGYEIKDNTDYQRLFKASKRYYNQLINGYWGYYSDDDIHNKINNVT